VRERCDIVLHMLDCFHVVQLMSKAIDETRHLEVRQLRAQGRAPLLTKTRRLLLKRPKNLRRSERGRLRDAIGVRFPNLRTCRDRPLSRARQPIRARLAHPQIRLTRRKT
jgi:Transposase